VLVVLPADHAIADVPAFHELIKRAVDACQDGSLGTLGVTPNRPETGYGYIEVGDSLGEGVHRVARFVEKPDLETAKGYLEGGRHVWNSGMFFFSAEAILAEIERQMPELYAGLQEIDAAIEAGDEVRAVADVYGRLEGESIDYGIMEGAKEIFVCPGEFGWNDVGSWAAAYEMREDGADEAGNVALADLIDVGSKGCLAWAEPRKVVALIGVHDLVVVDTADALLICPRDQSQKVKEVVNELKRRERKDLL
jgi:mannose-1-phosphate guanylyltransferase